MLENLRKYKKDLAELAKIINQFHSESVQVRLVEMLFGGISSGSPIPRPMVPEETELGKKTGAKSKTKQAAKPVKPRKMGALGALVAMKEQGFFTTKRGIAAVAEFCKTKLHLKLETNELSGPLSRLVARGELKREKNKSTGFFEYFA